MPDIPFFVPLTPEQREELERQRAKEEMAVEDYRHSQQRLFIELPKEHLLTVRLMFHALSNLDHVECIAMASYLEGLATASLHYRFKVCPGCGEDHDKEFFFADQESLDIDPTGKTDTADKVDYITEPMPVKGGDIPSLMEELDSGLLTADDIALMVQYNLDDVRDEDTQKLLGFICKGCGLRYISIEDRMLRPPGVEGCGGCQQKSAWG